MLAISIMYMSRARALSSRPHLHFPFLPLDSLLRSHLYKLSRGTGSARCQRRQYIPWRNFVFEAKVFVDARQNNAAADGVQSSKGPVSISLRLFRFSLSLAHVKLFLFFFFCRGVHHIRICGLLQCIVDWEQPANRLARIPKLNE